MIADDPSQWQKPASNVTVEQRLAKLDADIQEFAAQAEARWSAMLAEHKASVLKQIEYMRARSEKTAPPTTTVNLDGKVIADVVSRHQHPKRED